MLTSLVMILFESYLLNWASSNYLSLTVHIKSSWVWHFASSITRYTRIFATIFDHHMADIHMTYNISMNCYILTDEKSARIWKRNGTINRNLFMNILACTWNGAQNQYGIRKCQEMDMRESARYTSATIQCVTKQLDKCYQLQLKVIYIFQCCTVYLFIRLPQWANESITRRHSTLHLLYSSRWLSSLSLCWNVLLLLLLLLPSLLFVTITQNIQSFVITCVLLWFYLEP